jgi:peptidoglycan hydrolase-like protein with peptidoglycan-binding domain
MAVKPHSNFYSTSCPGSVLTSFAATLDGKALNTPAKPPPTAPKFPYPSDNYFGPESSDPKCHSGYYAKDQTYVRQIQTQLNTRGWKTTVDGKYGSQTKTNITSFQTKKLPNGVDGLTGPNTWGALWKP